MPGGSYADTGCNLKLPEEGSSRQPHFIVITRFIVTVDLNNSQLFITSYHTMQSVIERNLVDMHAILKLQGFRHVHLLVILYMSKYEFVKLNISCLE